MEAPIVTEGIRASGEMYGVKYTGIIANGDISVYKHILKKQEICL